VDQKVLGLEFPAHLTFDPGIMDTEMQGRIRASNESDFPELNRFIGFKKNNELLGPEIVGSAAGKVILGMLAQDKHYVTIEELLSIAH
jgi:benzil reductase ((S)-benzoin forming)